MPVLGLFDVLNLIVPSVLRSGQWLWNCKHKHHQFSHFQNPATHASIIKLSTKVILIHNYKFISGVGFTSVLLKFTSIFRKNNYWLGILVAVYIYQPKLLLVGTIRTIIRRITSRDGHEARRGEARRVEREASETGA